MLYHYNKPGVNMQTIRFGGDSATRRRFFTKESFSHPAKLHTGLFLEMLHRYEVKPGDWLLDPMAGSGTVLLATQYGVNVIANELESHFCIPMVKSWAKIQQNGPALGHAMGQAVILRGDARALPLPSASTGAVITSPPYEGQEIGGLKSGIIGNRANPSSPLLSRLGVETVGIGYTRRVDAIVTSPPFEQAQSGGGIAVKGHYDDPDLAQRVYSNKAMGTNSNENIGNQRGQSYWDSMRLCYQECWRVLRPGGILALVLKGFTRAGQYVDLPGQTEALLLGAGWTKHDHWRRELWSLSFWRILQKRRDPAAFDERLNFEEVLAFKKPEGAGKGVDAVITSPPYEGSLTPADDGIDWSKAKDMDRSKIESRVRGGSGRARGYTRPVEPSR